MKSSSGSIQLSATVGRWCVRRHNEAEAPLDLTNLSSWCRFVGSSKVTDWENGGLLVGNDLSQHLQGTSAGGLSGQPTYVRRPSMWAAFSHTSCVVD